MGVSAGASENWTWGVAKTMSLPDWQMSTAGAPALPTSNFDFFASNGPNNLANLKANETTTGQTLPSFSGLNQLQEQPLEERNESTWSTKFNAPPLPKLLPTAKATLEVATTFNYGDVYNLYILTNSDYPLAGAFPYGALHRFTIDQPIQFDFGQAILQPPLLALWTITATLTADRNAQGFFPVQGIVTLNEVGSSPTTIYLGEVYPF